MAATAQKKPVAPEPMTADMLAKKCGELMARRGALEKDLTESVEVCYSIERSRFDGQTISEAGYKKARARQGDCEAQMAALDRLVSEVMEKGQRVLVSETEQRSKDLNAERVALNAKKAAAIKNPVLSALISYFHEREKTTGQIFTQNDVQVIRDLDMRNLDDHARYVRAELSALRDAEDMAGTIAGRLKSLDDEMFQIRNGRKPSFEQMAKSNT
jgi:hypothetical protein